MRRWIGPAHAVLCLATLLVLTATGCSNATPGQAVPRSDTGTPTTPSSPPSASSSPLLEPTPFDAGVAGFTIQQPVGWLPDTSGRGGTDVVFVNPKPDVNGAVTVNASMNLQSPPGKGTLESLVATAKSQILQQFPDFRIIDDTLVNTASGQRAHLLGGTLTQNGQQLRNLLLITVGRDSGYVATGVTLEANYPRDEPFFRASLLTMTIKP